jgi:zinc protease
LVEEGLGDVVYSYYEPTLMNNLYYVIVYGVKDPDKVVGKIEELIMERPSDEELEFARERIMARLSFSMDTPSKLGQLYGLSQLFTGDNGTSLSPSCREWLLSLVVAFPYGCCVGLLLLSWKSPRVFLSCFIL